MVGLIEDQRAHVEFLEPLEEGIPSDRSCRIVRLVLRLTLAGTVEPLVRRDSEESGMADVLGYPAWRVVGGIHEKADEAGDPLVADGDRRGQDQGGAIQTPDYLQAEDGLARAGCGDDVQVVVVEMALQLGQHPLLVAAPGLAELNLGWKRFHVPSAPEESPIAIDQYSLHQNDAGEGQPKGTFLRLVSKKALAEQGTRTASQHRHDVQDRLRDAGAAGNRLTLVVPVQQQRDGVDGDQAGIDRCQPQSPQGDGQSHCNAQDDREHGFDELVSLHIDSSHSRPAG